MSDAPKVSIVVNNYNYAPFLGQAIESALSQTYPRTEVIVVDDGSTDDSRAVVESYGDRVAAVFKLNGGQGSVCDVSMSVASGDLVIFLDADDCLLPSAAEQAARRFERPGVVKIAWPLWVTEASGARTGRTLPDRPLPRGDLRQVVLRDGPDSYLSPPMSGNAWSRSYLEQVLPMRQPETYRNGADGYLITLAPMLGRLEAIADPQACYRVHGKNNYWRRSLRERIRGSLDRYARRSLTLQRYLDEAQIVHPGPAEWQRRNQYYQWLRRLDLALADLERLVDPGETFIVVDAGEWGTDLLPGRTAVPFLERNGEYWGAPPDAQTAVRELERLRASGAAIIAFGWPAFWWLEHYSALHDYLRATTLRVHEDARLVAFDLRRSP